MRNGISPRIVLATFVVCLCLADVAAAQTTKPQESTQQEPTEPEDSPEPLANAKPPYDALFGGASTNRRPGHTLNLNASVVEVYDQDEVDEGEPQLGGLYTSFTGDVDYWRSGSRIQVAASGGANLRYYHQLSAFLAADYRGSAGLEAALANRTTLYVSQALSLTPTSLPNLFATPLPPELGDPVPPGNSNFAVTRDTFVTSVTAASVEHFYSVRSQLVVRGSVRYNEYLGESNANGDWSMLDSGVVYRYRVTEARSVRAGYSYRRASYAFTASPDGRGPQPDEHNVFAGVAINRAFSAGQRTMASIDGGTAVFGATSPGDLRQPFNRLRFVMNAAVAHQIGQTWLFVGAFDRGNRFDQGNGAPVFGNAWSVSAGGFVNTRTDVTAWVSHTEGEPVLAVSGQGFTTSTAGGRVRYALSRRWAVVGEYFRYKYDFNNSPDYPFLTGVPQRFARSSVRFGVVAFWPIVPR
jgi:hypothetical protein